MDTLGPLPEDENEFLFIVVIVDNFSKFVGLYPAKSKHVERIYRCSAPIGILGVTPNPRPKEIRSDGGSQFTSKLSEDLSALLSYKHLVVVPYHGRDKFIPR